MEISNMKIGVTAVIGTVVFKLVSYLRNRHPAVGGNRNAVKLDHTRTTDLQHML